ncbi:hypothetical protein EJB05_21295, partial [Eragrostis curvula]
MSQFLSLLGRYAALRLASACSSNACSIEAEWLVYCMDYLEKNVDWLEEKLKPLIEVQHIDVFSNIDLIENYGNLAFNLDVYMDVPDLSFLPDLLDQDPRFVKYRKLTEVLCELINASNHTDFSTLDIQDKENVGNLVNLIDRANGYVFSSIDSSVVEFSKIGRDLLVGTTTDILCLLF